MDAQTAVVMAGQIASAVEPFSNVAGKAWTRRQERKWEQKRWERNRKAALDDWQIQNAYNHPTQVRMRLEEAGLNPALMYGGGNMPADAGGITQESTPAPDLPEFGNSRGAGAAILEAERVRQEINLLPEKKALLNAQTLKALAEIDRTKLRTELERQAFDEMLETFRLNNLKTSSSIETLSQGRKESEQRITESWQRIRESTMRMAKIAADTDFTLDENKRAEIRLDMQQAKTSAEIRLIAKKITTEISNAKVKAGQVEESSKRRDLMTTQERYIMEQLEYMPVDRARQWLETFIDALPQKKK